MKDTTTAVFLAGIDVAGRVESNSLKEGPLAPGASVEGDVYFEQNNKALDLVLKVFIADSAFEIPFSLPKR